MLTSNVVGPLRPDITPLTKFFWDGCAERSLRILRCVDCKFYVHLPRPVCPKCLGEDLQPEQISGRGVLYSHTTTTRAFDPFYVDKVPYVLAVVELEEQQGLRVASQMVNYAEFALRVGLEVEVQWVDLHETLTLPYFRPSNPYLRYANDLAGVK